MYFVCSSPNRSSCRRRCCCCRWRSCCHSCDGCVSVGDDDVVKCECIAATARLAVCRLLATATMSRRACVLARSLASSRTLYIVDDGGEV